MTQLTRKAVVYALVAAFILLSYVFYGQKVRWLGTEHKSFGQAHASLQSVYTPCVGTSLSPGEQSPPAVDDLSTLNPVKRHNVAVASLFGYHFDVYMALAWTLDRIRDRTPGLRLRVFADTFYYGFEDVVKNLGMYHGERYDANQLLSSMSDQNGDMIDLLILGTCEFE